MKAAVTLFVLCLCVRLAHADQLDGGLVVALPSALPTGASTGVGVGAERGGPFSYGARLAWTSATEYTQTWTVTQSDLRLRATGALERRVGRGTLALRLGLGGTLVHETRDRAQGQRAGLSGSDLEQTAWHLLPAGDLELAVALQIEGPWAMVLSGGPSLTWDGGANLGWLGTLGVAWRP